MTLIAILIVPPSAASAQTSNWSGFYIGGNAGYGWGNANGQTGAIDGAAPETRLIGLGPTYGTFLNPAASPGNPAKTALDGFTGGGQIGYNVQSRNWVAGIEADFQGSGQRSTFNTQNAFSSTVCTGTVGTACSRFTPVNYSAAGSYDARLDWFGTLRGRFGGLVTDNLLVYGTGGLAYGRVNVSGKTTMSGSGHVGAPFNQDFSMAPGSATVDITDIKIGFAVGAGIEGKIPATSNWSWKAEYLYVDLGSLTVSSPVSTGVATGSTQFAAAFSGTSSSTFRFADNIVRAGLNYRLAP